MKIKVIELPITALWWIRRQQRQKLWRLYHFICGSLKFKSIGKKVTFNGRVRVEHPYSNIVIGDNCMFGVGCYFLARYPGNIQFGKNVLVNDYCHITSCYSIEIGNNVNIAESVSIRDYDHEFKELDTPIALQGIKGAPIIIKDDVWIGRGVMITSGVTIGQGVIIGANAVVTKDIPAGSIAVGVPAKVIRSRYS